MSQLPYNLTPETPSNTWAASAGAVNARNFGISGPLLVWSAVIQVQGLGIPKNVSPLDHSTVAPPTELNFRFGSDMFHLLIVDNVDK